MALNKDKILADVEELEEMVSILYSTTDPEMFDLFLRRAKALQILVSPSIMRNFELRSRPVFKKSKEDKA